MSLDPVDDRDTHADVQISTPTPASVSASKSASESASALAPASAAVDDEGGISPPFFSRSHWRHAEFSSDRYLKRNGSGGGGNVSAARRHGLPSLRMASLGSAKAFSSDVQTPTDASAARISLSASDMPQARRESIPGAKPVAPSWHPDAPDGLKVRSPTDAVLLPELPLASMVNGKDTTNIAPNSGYAQSTVEDRVITSSIEPARLETEKVLHSADIKLQRPSIKVRIITWNQGNSVPKGDLGELLGRVGEYIAPEEGWDDSGDEEEGERDNKPKSRHRGMGVAGQEGIPRKDRIPPLPHDDAHPYHVVVIAGQECPWGDGKRISTGVGLAGELGDLSRSKSRAAEIARKKEAKEREKQGKQERSDKHDVPQTPGVLVSGEEDPFSHAVPLTPGGVTKARSGGRGWSEMCEDWLCRGPLAQATATKGLATATSAAIVSPAASGVQSPEEGTTPLHSRPPSPLPLAIGDVYEAAYTNANSSTKINATADSPMKRTSLAVPKRMIRSISRTRLDSVDNAKASNTIGGTGNAEDSSINEETVHTPTASRPDISIPTLHSADLPATDSKQQPPHQHHHRLAIRIPGLSGTHHVTVQSDGTPVSLGAYELVSKERCYMMYTAVYVWRGCLDRVRATSSGHVKSGLLAGRVGNKGAVGISLKLGTTRLLFVNAHLAAHEGKVAERIANVEKIKKELKVDTFLPNDDPRNNDDDITSCFDYAFWFGDLNFRVDITRKHADWLMMKKQYDHALAFDQLKKIMREQPTVFNKFNEAPITFPPTFKFDVLKTIKLKKQLDEEKARKHKLGSVVSVNSNVGKTDALTAVGEQSAPLSSPVTASLSGFIYKRGESDHHDEDASSISSAIRSSSAGGATSDQDDLISSPTSPDSSTDPQVLKTTAEDIVAQNTAAAEGMGVNSRAIKARHKLLHVMKKAVGHPEHAREVRKASGLERQHSRSTSGSIDFRATSEGEMAQAQKDVGARNAAAVTGSAGGLADQQVPFQSFAVDPRSNTSDVAIAVAADPSKRRTSVVAFAPPLSELDNERAADSDNDEEKQLYDTSAKQRVQSWCDRVLWRSNVAVPQDADLDEQARQTNPRPSRFTAKLSSALARLHVSKTEYPLSSNTFDSGLTPGKKEGDGPLQLAQAQARAQTRSQVPGQALEHRSFTIANAGRKSSETSVTSPYTSSPTGRKWFRRAHLRDEMYKHKNLQRANTMATVDHRLRTHSLQNPPMKLSSKRTQSATSVPAAVMTTSSGRSEGKEDLILPRKLPSPAADAQPRRTSFNFEWPRRQKQLSIPSPARSPLALERSADTALHAPATPASTEGAAAINSAPLLSKSSIGGGVIGAGAQTGRTTSQSATAAYFAEAPSTSRRPSRWNDLLNHFPTLVSAQESMANALANLGFRSATGHDGGISGGLTDEEAALQQQKQSQEQLLIGPRKGEIECLLYKSLNDREMRLLEGRSDHRPVIFVGSIGIGQSLPE